ncbi:MAG: OmpH family outer membrane protein [Bryobacteraceae bacterium]|jgi:Skp family chaperone for outer membrane proteins
MTRIWIAPAFAALSGMLSGLCAQTPTASPAPLPPQKIAVIDMTSALVSTKDGQKAVADLRAKYQPRDQAIQKRSQELQQKQEQYRKAANTLSEEAKANYERDIELLNRNLQRDTTDAKQEMDEDQQHILQDLGSKIMQVVNKYAVDNQISIVFDVGGEPNNIRFASSAVDITRDIIALYDKAAPVTPTAPPAKPAAPASTSAAPAPKPATAAPKPATAAPAPK